MAKQKIHPTTIAAGRHDKKRGSKRMKEFGYKRIELWFDAKEWSIISDRIAKTDLPAATFLRKLIVRDVSQLVPGNSGVTGITPATEKTGKGAGHAE